MYPSSLFVACLAGALIIHARNQSFLSQTPSARALAWALCSRRLCSAAIWAAAATAMATLSQTFMMWPHLGSNESYPTLMLFGLLASGIATLIAMYIAFTAVSAMIPKFDLGSLVSAEPSDAAPDAKNN